MVSLIDTHAHLDEQAFEQDLDEVLSRAAQAGIAQILTIGINAETSQRAVLGLWRLEKQGWTAIGILLLLMSKENGFGGISIWLVRSINRLSCIAVRPMPKYWPCCRTPHGCVPFRG